MTGTPREKDSKAVTPIPKGNGSKITDLGNRGEGGGAGEGGRSKREGVTHACVNIDRYSSLASFGLKTRRLKIFWSTELSAQSQQNPQEGW
jgi:hypothetical protein